ncbi:hypothetical protein N0V86_001907 [Didymella sp. IMI 355093]|nr:hypothetical protein N0V86_001907 [Didymella sp. IMI 355093]
MRIPTELRLMIFRFLLPKRVEAKDYFDKRPFGVLRANRQFYEEASAVVYSEIRFTAAVFPTCIDLFGRRWHRESTTEPYKDLNTTLCQAGARRVRHLEIHIHFGDTHKTIKGVGGASLPYEEYEIYQARDTVRKLVQLMSPEPLKSKSKALQHLKVMAKPAPKQSWQIDEIIAAIFCILDPLLALGPIDDCVLSTPLRPNVWGWRYGDWARLIGEVHQDEAYRRLRKQWLGSIRGSSSQFIVTRNPTAAAVEAYNKVEDFSRLVYNQDAAQSRGKAQFKHGWTGSAFRGIERVLHIARVAYEDGQLETLQSIHQAIMRRWVKTHAQHVLSFTAVANTVSDMFEDVSTVDGYDSKAFDFEQATSSKEALKDDDMWSELEVKRIALERLYNPGTTVKEKGARVKVCTDDGQRVYLKTPSVARQLREYKRRKEQMP